MSLEIDRKGFVYRSSYRKNMFSKLIELIEASEN